MFQRAKVTPFVPSFVRYPHAAQAWLGLSPDEVSDLVLPLLALSPPRQWETPMGRMSVHMTSAGALGWTSDKTGYRYSALDPASGTPWPAIPEPLLVLAREAAKTAGFAGFAPDSCIINEYHPGARMGLHQDKDEQDFAAPVVSLSLGLPATFLFGGLSRTDPVGKTVLEDGDVVVWGGRSRLAFHGIAPLKKGVHPLWGERRLNLTFRRAG